MFKWFKSLTKHFGGTVIKSKGFQTEEGAGISLTLKEKESVRYIIFEMSSANITQSVVLEKNEAKLMSELLLELSSQS